jgi:signal transduction histidine kinase
MTLLDEQPRTAAAARIEELGRIILAYSEVTEKLQQSHERLEQTVLRLREELSEKNRLLERKNRLAALGEMAAGMAHEIRNPLGGIQLYASMLSKDVADRPDSQQLVEKIRNGVKRLEGLVGQILHFTRDLRPTVEATDLAEIVSQAIELAQQVFVERGVTCSVDVPRPFAVQVDSRLIGQVVLNLVLNAAEAMSSGGTIALVCHKPGVDGGEKQFTMTVEDDGPGVTPEVMERIFNPFFTTKDTGTGLGLAIVHRIVEAHDGSIRVSNRPQGGARFEIRI